jgi:hypothetical protein
MMNQKEPCNELGVLSCHIISTIGEILFPYNISFLEITFSNFIETSNVVLVGIALNPNLDSVITYKTNSNIDTIKAKDSRANKALDCSNIRLKFFNYHK